MNKEDQMTVVYTEHGFDCTKVTLENWEGFEKYKFNTNPNRNRSIFHVCQMSLPEGFCCRDRHGKLLVGEVGDYLVIDKWGEKFIVSKELFQRKFIKV